MNYKSLETDDRPMIIGVNPIPSAFINAQQRALQSAQPISINMGQAAVSSPMYMGGKRPYLWQLVQRGAAVYPLARNSFVDVITQGAYAYSKRVTYRTCVIAAAYVGAFGADAITQAGFSHSQAMFRIALRIGWDISKLSVTGPTGRQQMLDAEIVQLVDKNLWDYAGVIEWLAWKGL